MLLGDVPFTDNCSEILARVKIVRNNSDEPYPCVSLFQPNTELIHDGKFGQSHHTRTLLLLLAVRLKTNFISFGDVVMAKRKRSKCARSEKEIWGDMLRLVQQQETN